MQCFIAGVGEGMRADDAAGLIAVRELRRLGIPAEELHDFFILPDLLSGKKCAILIDAVVCDAPPGEVLILDGRQPLEKCLFPVSSHGFGLREALQLTQALGCMPEEVRIYGISAGSFCLGEAPSPEVEAGARRAALLIQQTLTSHEPNQLGPGS